MGGKTQDEPVSGRLDLVDHFHETSSTHADTTQRAFLAPHGHSGVVLETYHEYNNVYENCGPPTSSRWAIDREALIKLIKEHGQRVG